MAALVRTAVLEVVNRDSATSQPITARQNEPQHLTRLLAYSHEYWVAQIWHSLRVSVTLILALASPLILIFLPHLSDLLAASAGAWLVIGRTVFTALEDGHHAEAVRIQELYDTRLFQLPWNAALAGREPAPEDVELAASGIKSSARYRDWYDVDLRGLAWPADVLLCQRQSAIWSRRDHRAYAFALAIAGAGWFAVGLIVAIVRDMTVGDYLVKLFLPSAPAYLDAVDLALSHWRHSAARRALEEDISDLWAGHDSNPEIPTAEDCRRIQDRAFTLRRHGPRVPDWFYRLRRPAMARSTAAGARALVEEGRGHH